MITLPPGFDVSQLVSDFAELAVPVVVVTVLIISAKILYNILRKA